MKGMRSIAVDIGELGWARDDHILDHRHYLDLDTGEVLSIHDDLPDGEEEEGLDERIEAESGTRYLEVPKPEPGEGYRDMADFVGTVTDPTLNAMLSVAIQGAGAFGRFRNVLLGFPEEREEWFTFKDARTRERLEDWLRDEGVEVEWTGRP